MMKANAVIFTKPMTVEYREVNCPDPGPADVVVRVTHSWISNGTEGSYLRGERISGDTPLRPGDPWPFPIVRGYQKVGVVEWAGADVLDIAVGETVFATNGKVEGMFATSGGHISPSVTPRNQVWKLPPGIEPLAFSGAVLTQVGYNAGSRAPIEVGEHAVIIGDGLVGQWAAQTLAWRGAKVVLVGRRDDRLAKFQAGPWRHTINAHQQPWDEAVRALCPSGMQVAIDTAGSIEAMEKLVPLMKRYGHLVSAGFYGTADQLALQPLRDAELSVDLVSAWAPDRIERTLTLIAAGYLETMPLITHHFPVSQAAAAWQLINQKSEPVLGVILDWEAAF